MEYVTIVLEFFKSLGFLILFFTFFYLFFYFIIIPIYMGIMYVISWLIKIIDDLFSHTIFDSFKSIIFFVIGFLGLMAVIKIGYFTLDIVTTLIAKA